MDNLAIKSYIQNLEHSTISHEEKLALSLQGLIELFPFKEASLHSYSTMDKRSKGIIRVNENGVFSLVEYGEDMRNIPFIFAAIREKTPKYIPIEYLKQIPAKPITVITARYFLPIINYSTVIGFSFLIPKATNTTIQEESLLHFLNIYGKYIGKILGSDVHLENPFKLSKREVEILQRMSWGESTQEMADIMGISPFTVKEYVKSALKKLAVQNRVQGVAEAIRKGIIS